MVAAAMTSRSKPQRGRDLHEIGGQRGAGVLHEGAGKEVRIGEVDVEEGAELPDEAQVEFLADAATTSRLFHHD